MNEIPGLEKYTKSRGVPIREEVLNNVPGWGAVVSYINADIPFIVDILYDPAYHCTLTVGHSMLATGYAGSVDATEYLIVADGNSMTIATYYNFSQAVFNNYPQQFAYIRV